MNSPMQLRPTGPDFIGIGAPRCGTTWLHRVLDRHEDVWLPPIKEIHYLDSLDPTIRYRQVERLSFRVKSQLHRRLMHYPASALSPLSATLRARARPDWRWDANFFRPGSGMPWYNRLFDSQKTKFACVGEFSPEYFMVDRELIKRLRDESGVRRFIVSVRDPFESLWSHFGKINKDSRTVLNEKDVLPAFNEFLDRGVRRRLYANNLRNWIQYFPWDSFLIIFFDDIVSHPRQVFERVCQFLSLPSTKNVSDGDLHERVNSSLNWRGNMPALCEKAIAERLVADLTDLSSMIGGSANTWRDRAQLALGRT